MSSDTTPQPQKGRPRSATAATAAAEGAGSFLLPETDWQSKGKTLEFPVGAAPLPRRGLVKRDLIPFPPLFSFSSVGDSAKHRRPATLRTGTTGVQP
jgi:hypothetical protein